MPPNSNGLKGEDLTILIVEDNLDHSNLIMRILAQKHVVNKIIHLTDGQLALDYLFRQNEYKEVDSSPRPHVILLDLRLPKVDGLDVLKQIKNNPELLDIPVVILSTSSADLDIAKAYSYHANSYLVKPLDFNSLSQLLTDFGFYWLAWNQHPWKS